MNKKAIRLLGVGIFLIISITLLSIVKPLPKGLSINGKSHITSEVEFLYDLSYQKDGKRLHEQNIFNKVFQLIREADNFIIVDMFLFNSEYDRKYQFPKLSENLTNSLIEKKNKNPNIKIFFITDEINTFYGSYKAKNLERLKANDITVIMTDMSKAKDSNPLYSGVWNFFLKWAGTSDKGWIRNPFSSDSPDVTLRSFLKLLNFKANHRKILVTEKRALITSANPHDASAYHSNIGFVFNGPIIKDIVEAEKSVANISGKDITVDYVGKPLKEEAALTSLLTEGKIRENIIDTISRTNLGDSIKIGMFYLSERDIIEELIEAAKRGVDIKLILDPNKDAFGREKNGIPNRIVADELFEKTQGKIKIRWYDTQGEQYHTKLIMVKFKDSSIIFGGSANLTKRNIGDYNLEADVKIQVVNSSQLVEDIDDYFQRIWDNEDGHYTVDFEKYHQKSLLKKIVYRFQEWSGLSTF